MAGDRYNQLVQEFLGKKRIAIWGVEDAKAEPGQSVARKFRSQGIQVIAVNPKFSDDPSQQRASSLIKIDPPVEAVLGLPYKPNLNDGVLISACPLWELFRLPKWQKDLKACWDDLSKGEYDWAHLAYTIWPKRVEDACKKDGFVAIAHGLEHLCEVRTPETKGRRGRKKTDEQMVLEDAG